MIGVHEVGASWRATKGPGDHFIVVIHFVGRIVLGARATSDNNVKVCACERFRNILARPIDNQDRTHALKQGFQVHGSSILLQSTAKFILNSPWSKSESYQSRWHWF